MFNSFSHICKFRMPFYAVARGRNVGICNTWNECEQQVKGFSGARFKKFNTEADANSFIRENSNSGSGNQTASSNNRYSHPAATTQANTHSYQPTSSSYNSSTSSSFSQPRSTNTTVASRSTLPQKQTLPEKDDYVNVYTDGASSNNGRGGAAAGIGVYWGPHDRWNVSERLKGRQTNNRAEIHAVRRSVEQAHVRGIKKLQVFTDSEFLINSYTKWMPKWKQNDWKLSHGGNVKNKADFIALEEMAQGIDLKFVHVAGHAGVPGNEEADKLAVAGAKLPYLYNQLDYSIDGDEYYDDLY